MYECHLFPGLLYSVIIIIKSQWHLAIIQSTDQSTMYMHVINLSSAWVSVAGFQLGSNMMTLLAPVTFNPVPPHLHKWVCVCGYMSLCIVWVCASVCEYVWREKEREKREREKEVTQMFCHNVTCVFSQSTMHIKEQSGSHIFN